MAHEEVCGIHDMIVHDYGPGRIIASVHAEVPYDMDILKIHDVIDNVEQEIADKLNIIICIHMDPVVTNDETVNKYKNFVAEVIKDYNEEFSFHDFRMVQGETHTNVIFDLVVAIIVGVILATVMFMKRMSDVTDAYGWKEIDENTDDENIRLKKVPENTMVFEITGPIFFGASTKIADVIKNTDKQVLILRMRSVPAIDATGLHSFETIIKLCKKQNKTLILSHVNEQPMKSLEKAKLVDEVLFADNIDAAIEMATVQK